MKPLRAFGIGIFLAGAAFGVQHYVADKPDDKPTKQTKVIAANDDKLEAMQQKNDKLTAQVATLEKKLATQKAKAKKAAAEAKTAKKKAEEAAKQTAVKTESPKAPASVTPTTAPAAKPASDQYNLTITSAMGSTEITKQLQHAGIISNAREFEQYIIAHNKATSLQNGTFQLKKGMSYDAILNEIAQ
jgi:predicted flap endonuclease-1-like 5' DNA nuclease